VTSDSKTAVKCKWFVDSLQDQEREGRYKICNNNFKHTGHIKRPLPNVNVSEEMAALFKQHYITPKPKQTLQYQQMPC
jgi:hypothetical protein